MSRSSNAEIARTWFIQVAERQHRPAYPQLKAHLSRYGRTRLVQPVYEALAANGEDRELARELFDQARAAYHPLTQAAIEPLFE
jgi:TPR repeat protein